jgi:predicted RNase H-like nuclease (RuvC/YqgF family)
MDNDPMAMPSEMVVQRMRTEAEIIEDAIEPYQRRIRELEEELAWAQHELEQRCK